jgi:hypothetical protein
VVGYDNNRKAWLVKNSWGTDWGDKGYFWVGYDAAGICPSGDTWGWSFQPDAGRPQLRQRLARMRGGGGSCWEYTSRPGDHMASLAYKYGLALSRLLLDNVSATQQPWALSPGTRLRLCNISLPDALPPDAPQRQMAALLDIKEALAGGEPAAVLSDWLLTRAAAGGGYCKWSGVRCAADGQQVLGLMLHSQGLAGTLPSGAVLCRLPNLVEIQITGNIRLVGTLPRDWDRCPQLRGIHLQDNGLSGTLPDSWGALSALQHLRVQVNRLTGPLPANWGRMTSLKHLWLFGNALTGTLPPQWSGMVAVEVFFVSYSNVTGQLPAAYGAWRNIANIGMEENKLTGTLPPQWSRMQTLEALKLDGNPRLTGGVPPSWGDLRSLNQVQLQGMPRLSGCLPPAWRRVTNVRIQGSGFSGFCP